MDVAFSLDNRYMTPYIDNDLFEVMVKLRQKFTITFLGVALIPQVLAMGISLFSGIHYIEKLSIKSA